MATTSSWTQANNLIAVRICHSASWFQFCNDPWNRVREGYIDIGDGFWWPNVLVASLECWWHVTYESLMFFSHEFWEELVNGSLDLTSSVMWFILSPIFNFLLSWFGSLKSYANFWIKIILFLVLFHSSSVLSRS